MASGPGDGEWDHTEAGGDKRTSSASGIHVVTESDGESNSLGDGVSLGDGNIDLQGLDVADASTNTNLG